MKSALTLLVTGLVFFAHTGNAGENPNEYLLQSVLYVQQSSEYRALCYQSYRIAEKSLDIAIKSPSPNKPLAVIVDVDETVLDNSPYEAWLITENKTYPSGWEDWVNSAHAKPVPGTLEFLKHADSNRVDIFYVTNRREKYLKPTMQNLTSEGFPQVTEDHLYLRTGESSKESRRQDISKTHAIVLLIGDNLDDLAQVFESNTNMARTSVVDSIKTEFGDRFIVIPNPMYGDWEGNIFHNNWSMSPVQKDSTRQAALIPFKP